MSMDKLLLVVDIQEGFSPVIFSFDSLVKNVVKLIKSFNLFKVPMILTEQYPKGLGKTIKSVDEVLKDYEYIEKISFDCFKSEEFKKTIERLGAKEIIICGIEAHVCIVQTVLSALKDYKVTVVADAVSSRSEIDYDIALRRMEQEGAKLATTEMVIFSMMADSKDMNFKEISKIVK